DVIHRLANGPLVRSVAMERLLFRDVFEERQSLVHLILEGLENIGTGNFADVGEVILGSLSTFGEPHHVRHASRRRSCVRELSSGGFGGRWVSGRARSTYKLQ